MTSFNLDNLSLEEKDIPEFILKLYSILQNPDFSAIIGWSMNGSQIQIKNQRKLESQILPTYFRHQKLESFIRQLNMYRFKKVNKIGKQKRNIFFKNQFFRKQDVKSLHLIKRRKKGQEEQEEPDKDLHEYKSFIRQHMNKIQQNLSILLSKCPQIFPQLTNIIHSTQLLTGQIFTPNCSTPSTPQTNDSAESVRDFSSVDGLFSSNKNLKKGEYLGYFDSKCSIDINFIENFLN